MVTFGGYPVPSTYMDACPRAIRPYTACPSIIIIPSKQVDHTGWFPCSTLPRYGIQPFTGPVIFPLHSASYWSLTGPVTRPQHSGLICSTLFLSSQPHTEPVILPQNSASYGPSYPFSASSLFLSVLLSLLRIQPFAGLLHFLVLLSFLSSQPLTATAILPQYPDLLVLLFFLSIRFHTATVIPRHCSACY